MKVNTRFRILGALSILLAVCVICWQLLPGTSAQDKEPAGEAETSKIEMPLPDNTDEILLNAQRINVKSDLAKPDEKQASVPFDGKRLHLVRFNGPIRSAWVDSLRGKGLFIVDYIPHYTYLVYGDYASIERMRSDSKKNAASPIEWEGPYRNEYRIMPHVYASAGKAASGLRTDAFEIQLVKDKDSNERTMQAIDSVRRGDIIGLQEVRHYVNFIVSLDEKGLDTVADLPDVISIHPHVVPEKNDERQNFILRGNLTGNEPTVGDYLSYLAGKGFTQAQFDASNFVVDLSDSGVGNANPANENQWLLRRLGDPAQASRIVYSRLEGTPNTGSTLQGCDGHGNINASIIGGYVPTGGIFAAAPHADALGYRYGLGVAPFVKIGSSVIFDPNSYTNPNLPNLQSRAYADGARISSNSWGANVAGAYNASSQAYDGLVRDAQPASSVNPTAGNQEMVIVFAAGNAGAGSQTVGSPATGKNVITVGASENVHPFGGADACGSTDADANSANDIVGFSSRGPTADGRKKPDIVLPGTHVSGGVGQNTLSNPVAGNGGALTCFTAGGVCAGPGGSDFWPLGGQQWYTASSGTSHSTPAISGFAALIRQHFINTAPTGGSPGSGTPPSPAMTKALMMNTAAFMNGSGANDNLPSNNQGMGRANMDNFFDVFAQARILSDQDPARTFTDSGQQHVIGGTIVDPSKPFRVTLAWTDAPGATSGNSFVNNLDLEVVVSGQTYRGNVFTKGNSTAGGTADIRNNVESVFLPAGATGNFIIRVKATNIAGDGLPGNADTTDQDFALVVWNGNEAPVAVVSGGATQITAESCAINGAIDPAETVTVNFDLSNVGIANTTNLVATLLPTGGVSAPSGPQNYGALTAGGPAVTRPFTFTAATTCGQNLVATLQLQDGATNLGTVTFTFLTGTLAAPSNTTVSTGNLTTPIPDNTTVNIPINVTTTGALSDLNVKVRLNHTFDADVQMSLTSPGGVTVPLVSGRGGSGDNFGSGANDCTGTFTVFDDSAATAISAGTAPFAGSFRPESPLSAFNGQSITGIWTLSITDTATQDTGTLGCAQLEITRQRYVCCGVAGTPEVSSGGAATIVSESFIPLNNAPDPNETVTINVPLINTGDGPTTNLVATLQSSGGVTPVTTSQNYGVLTAGGAAVTRPFTFVANGPCGGSITATFQLQDGSTNLGTVTHTFQLGTIQNTNQTFSNTSSISIPNSGTATPYPSTITVSGAPTTITRASVTLNGFTHTFPGDVDVLLVSPTGRKFVLMSDAGASAGSAVSNATFTFDDTASAILPSTWTTLPPGPYRPTNYGATDTFAAPAPAAPYLHPATAGTETLTSAFGGATGGDPNGTWSLYVVDDASGDSGSFSGGWSLTLTTATPVCSTTPGGPTRTIRADYDGDGKTDLSIWRPSDGTFWVNRSTDGPGAIQWGANGDTPMAADMTGDREADIIINRFTNVEQVADFWVLGTPSFSYIGYAWGLPGDVPVMGDFNGDGKDDMAVWRSSDRRFYILMPDDANPVRIFDYGLPGDKPFAGNFLGDGRSEIAVFRPSNGTWYIAQAQGNPSTEFVQYQFGLGTDLPVPADFDGDGKDDIAVYRPSNGTWYIWESQSQQVRIVQWGVSTDIPVPGDYDGDNKYDVAIYRSGQWWILGSLSGVTVRQWGLAGDMAMPRSYLPQ